jgi:hypothetical protein
VTYDKTEGTLFDPMPKCVVVTDALFFRSVDHNSPFTVQNSGSLEGFRSVVLGHSGHFSEFLV